MVSNPLTRAWLSLLFLSGVATALAIIHPQTTISGVTGAALLCVSWLKARIILSRYLGLWRAPDWQAGFTFVVALFCLIALGLYFAPLAMS